MILGGCSAGAACMVLAWAVLRWRRSSYDSELRISLVKALPIAALLWVLLGLLAQLEPVP